MIVVDMDGTFLNDKKEYNRERFNQLFTRLQEKNIQFVVASGNQYAQLKSFFPDTYQDMTFVAENGAFIIEKEKEIFAENIPLELIQHTLQVLDEIRAISVVVCGKKSAYVLDSSDKKFIEIVHMFYHKLEVVETFQDINDQILKLALGCSETQMGSLHEQLKEQLKKDMTPVSSGTGSIDLIRTGTHKANGLKRLAKVETIKPDELMVFGDGGNDIEMLQFAKYSFAMANAECEIKNSAAYEAPSNNEEGVLEVIEQFILQEDPLEN
nr:Cof-type HAD-IIB family hydrolase [Desemzia sp. RIT 804]